MPSIGVGSHGDWDCGLTVRTLPARHLVTMMLSIALTFAGARSGAAVRAAGPSTKEAVSLAARYVAWYDARLTRLVADERYEQHSVDPQYPGGRSLILQSEIAWVPAPDLQDLLAVRDVHAVDGRVVQASRIRALLNAGPSASEMAQEILRASAAFNLGPGTRNLNLPTFPLVYLRGDRPDRLRWRSHSEPDGAIRLELEERERPTIVRDPDGRPMRARGQFWLEPSSGRIVRAHISIVGRHESPDEECGRTIRRDLTYTIAVEFEANERLGLWLPSRMSEKYEEASRRNGPSATEVLTGEARYTNYRRFETEGRVLPSP